MLFRSVCIPNDWQATFYPAGRNYNFRIEYANNKTTVYTDKNLTQINISELNFSNQKVPYKPEDFDELYNTIGGKND